MKIIFTFLSILGFQFSASSQIYVSGQVLNVGKEQTKIGYVVSRSEEKSSRARFTPSNQDKEIVITSLPTLSAYALTSVEITLETLGSFTFKKDPSLMIPFKCEVFIEDKVSGKIFNLKTSGAYTFEVEQHAENRFVMHILDKTSTELFVTSSIKKGSETKN